MFNVIRCVPMFDDVSRTVVAEFATEAEAEEFVAVEERCDFFDVWYEVTEIVDNYVDKYGRLQYTVNT